MPHQCETICKNILKDTEFNPEQFLATGFADFWTQINDYLMQFGSKQEKGLFKRAKYPNCTNILLALEKVIPMAKEYHFKADQFPIINKIFCQFLHPDTPQEYRDQSLQILLQILNILRENQLIQFYPAISLIVPYQRFYSQTDPEKSSYGSLLAGVQPIIDPSKTNGGTPEGVIDLRILLRYIQSRWKDRTAFSVDVLFKNVIYILYRSAAEKAECRIPYTYGFKSTPPEPLQAEFFIFIENLISNALNLEPLFQTPQNTKLLIYLTENVSKYNEMNCIITATKFLTRVITNTNIQPVIVKLSYLLEASASTVCLFVRGFSQIALPELIQVQSQDFFHHYFRIMFSIVERPVAFPMIEEVFNKYRVDIFVIAYIMQSILHYLISELNWDTNIWQLMIKIINDNPVLSAVSAHYAQYLALLAYPIAFRFENTEQIIKDCVDHARRIQRTHQNKPNHLYVAENIAAIINDPETFVQLQIKSFYLINQGFDSFLSRIPFQKLSVDSHIIDTAMSFLKQFENYKQCPSSDIQRLMFSPIVSFAAILEKLRFIPAGIHFDRTAPYKICSRYLFSAILSQSDIMIRKMAFEILALLINNGEMKNLLSQKDLSYWYDSLALMMLSKDIEMRDKGFQEAVSTLQHAFTGSSILMPTMMILCEKGFISVNESMISFISSLPLFTITPTPPSQFTSKISEFIKANSSTFIELTLDFVQPPTSNLRNRAIDLVQMLYEITNNSKGIKKWEQLLPAIQVILADELTQEQPNAITISTFLIMLTSPLADRSFEVFHILRSCLMYFPQMVELIPADLTNFVERVLGITCDIQTFDDAEWTFYMIKLAADICMYSYELIMKSDAYMKYIQFLISNLSDKSILPPETKSLIKNLIDLLSVNFGRYPYPDGIHFASNVKTTIFDTDAPNSIYAANNTIIHPKIKDNKVYISTQMTTGHYMWEFESLDSLFFDSIQPPEFDFNIGSNQNPEIEPSISLPEQKEFSSVFDTLIHDYQKEFNENLLVDNYNADVSAKINQISGLIQQKSDHFNKVHINPEKNQYVEPPTSPTNLTAAALTECGLYQINNPESISTISPSKQVNLTLHDVESKNHRLGIKIGVVYVKTDVYAQNQILSTTFDQTSNHFKEFITGLGYPIDLATHIGYDGGLDLKNNRNGKTSIYYADFMNEIMFHAAPLLPTDPSDDQQIYKKRHIGNDHIHIVWCEQKGEYDSSTITSQFNQAHIIIYPLPNALFRVDICWKEELTWFGPLRKSIIVTKRTLPSLVRATAMSAMNSYIRSQSKYMYPQNEISKSCNEILAERESKRGNSPLQKLMVMNE